MNSKKYFCKIYLKHPVYYSLFVLIIPFAERHRLKWFTVVLPWSCQLKVCYPKGCRQRSIKYLFDEKDVYETYVYQYIQRQLNSKITSCITVYIWSAINCTHTLGIKTTNHIKLTKGNTVIMSICTVTKNFNLQSTSRKAITKYTMPWSS